MLKQVNIEGLELIRDQLAVIKTELAYVERQIQLLIVNANYGIIDPVKSNKKLENLVESDADRIDTLGANH